MALCLGGEEIFLKYCFLFITLRGALAGCDGANVCVSALSNDGAL